MADAYTGQDTIILEDYNGKWVLTGLGKGTVAELNAPNELGTVDTGYNGNSLGSHNEPGRQRELTLRLVKGCSDDKRLNNNYNLWKDRSDSFVPLRGYFTKLIKNAYGANTYDTVECYFGLPSGQPTQQTVTDGNTDQVESVYVIKFGNSKRVM